MPSRARSYASRFSLLTAGALALQSAGGVFIPGLYKDNAWVSAVLRGADLVALVLVVPLLLGAHAWAQSGSLRGRLIWLGVLSRIFYNNLYLLFGADFNYSFLLYVAVFVFSSFAVVAAPLCGDAEAVAAIPIQPSHRKVGAAIMLASAGLLTVMWVGQSIAYVATGTLPKLVTDGGGGTHLVAALDLTTIVPPLVLGAIWLWQSRPWGLVISAAILVQCFLITVDLMVTPFFQAAAGVSDAWTMVPLWAVMAAGFVVGAVLLLRTVPAQPGTR